MLPKLSNPLAILSFITALQIILSVLTPVHASVDYSYCKVYNASSTDDPDQTDETGRPVVFIGETNSKKYYLMSKKYSADYFDAAYGICLRFNLQLAMVKTACEYGILEKWFKSRNTTTYSAWIAGFRFGDNKRRPPLWCTSGEPLDLSQCNINADYIGGPYPPGGYSPIPYPWVNCLSVSRNCPLYTSGPTNPCTQTPTYPDLQFMWLDCRDKIRVICEETSYSKEGNELDSELD